MTLDLDRERPMGLDLRRPADLVSTFFGVGLLPLAPGTFGSLAAVPVAWLIDTALGPLALAGASVLVFVFGARAANITVKRTGVEDPGFIVIDEVAGQWLVLAVAPLDPAWYAAGFVLFRIVDIAKPWPASWIDEYITGGIGVMADDVVAALYAIIALLIAHALVPGAT